MADSLTYAPVGGGSPVTLNFGGLLGIVQHPAQKVEILAPRIGTDGIALRRLGKRGVPFTLESWADATTQANALTAELGYAAAEGTLCNIVQNGETFTDFAILAVELLPRDEGLAAVGGLAHGKWLVSARWTFIYAGVP